LLEVIYLAEGLHMTRNGYSPIQTQERASPQKRPNPFRDLTPIGAIQSTEQTVSREEMLTPDLVPILENACFARQHDLGMTLDQVELNLIREVIMGEAERVATALWIAQTYIYTGFKLTPRLFITSGDPECGKSTLLARISEMSNGGMYLTGATISHLGRVRTEKGENLTITLDQLDNAFDLNATTTGPMIDRLIAGADRGAKIGFSEKINGRWTPVEGEISYPMALAKIGALPSAALRSRCIVIQMHPATPAEARQLSTHSKGRSDENIRALLAKVMGPLASELATAKPSMPAKLINRGADKWRPLLAIAEEAGGDWPKRALAAAEELESYETERPPHVVLLRKVMAITKDWPHEVIFSEELDRELDRADPSERTEIARAKHRARLLDVVGLKAERHWRDGKQLRGYRIADIRRADEQYIRDTYDG
jgi:hypothetical protein